MDAVGAQPRSQRAILAHEQNDATAASRRGDAFAASQGVGGAESAVDDRRTMRQARDDSLGVRRADRIGEEQQRRQGLCSATPSP